MKPRETNYTLWYEDLEYKGHVENFSYDVTFDDLMKAIRKYFENQLVNLDGTNTDVYNALVDLGDDVIDNIFDTMEEWLKEQCQEEAQEAYQEYVDWYYEDTEE